MESSIFKFIFHYSKKEQVKLLLLTIMIVVDAIFAGKVNKIAKGEVPEKFAIFNALHGINGLCFIAILFMMYVGRHLLAAGGE